jgi:hypothetical protein
MKTNIYSISFYIVFNLLQVFAGNADAKEIQVRAVFKKPEIISSDQIEFYTGKSRGLQLSNKQCFEFILPESLRGRIPDYAYIRHRKEYVYSSRNQNGLDINNAWLQVSFHNPEDRKWYIWSDQFGPIKRSAARSADKPKKNTLYNFIQNVGFFSPDKVRITNLAEGDPKLAISSVHALGIVFLNQRKSNDSVTRVFSRYSQPNSLTLRYIVDKEHGLELQKGNSFVFAIPEKLQNKSVFHIILKHRKAFSLAYDPLNPEAFDPDAAYVRIEARDRRSGYWHCWADRSSLAKFSEVRAHDNAENETLHNCLRTFGPILPDKIRVTNVGQGDPLRSVSRIHELEIVFFPDLVSSMVLENIFTPETVFCRPDKNKPVSLLGGGPRLGGKFPGALVLGKNLGKRISLIKQLPEEYRFDTGPMDDEQYKVNSDGELLIRLPQGKKIESVELAIGDLDITSKSFNKDGYFGRSGSAQASVILVGEKKSELPLLTNNNIGMAGIIVCGGPTREFITGINNFIKIVVKNDNAFLMGYRILLK